MKKLIAIFAIAYILMALPILAIAQTMHPANQITVAWDSAEHATGYIVYLKPIGSDDASQVGETAETQYTITLAAEGQYLIGVKSVRTEQVNGVATVVGESATIWSDDPAVVAEDVFGVYHFLPPGAASGLRKR